VAGYSGVDASLARAKENGGGGGGWTRAVGFSGESNALHPAPPPPPSLRYGRCGTRRIIRRKCFFTRGEKKIYKNPTSDGGGDGIRHSSLPVHDAEEVQVEVDVMEVVEADE